MGRAKKMISEDEDKCCKERCSRKGSDEEYHGQIFRIDRIRKIERIIQEILEKESEQPEVVGKCQERNGKEDRLDTVDHLTASLEEFKTN